MIATANFDFIFNKVIHVATYFCGTEMRTPNYKQSWRTVLYFMIVSSFVVSSIYSIVAKDLASALKNLALMATAIQVTGHIITDDDSFTKLHFSGILQALFISQA